MTVRPPIPISKAVEERLTSLMSEKREEFRPREEKLKKLREEFDALSKHLRAFNRGKIGPGACEPEVLGD